MFLIATAAGWLGSAMLVLSAAERESAQQGDEDLVRSGELLLGVVKHEYVENRGDISRLEPMLPNAPNGIIVQIISPDGKILLRTQNAPEQRLNGPSISGGGFDLTVSDDPWRGVSVRDAENNLQIILAESIQRRHHSSNRLAIALWAPVLIGLPVLALFAQLFSRRALQPLAEVAEDLSKRSATDLNPIPFLGLPLEAQPLLNSFNGLLQRLAQVVDDQRHFASTVAHELRTPLASLKLDLQLLNQECSEGDRSGLSIEQMQAMAQRASQTLPRTLQTLDRTTQVIEQLLVLARLETSKAAPAQSSFDLQRLVEEILRQFSLRIERRELNLAVDVEPIALGGFEHPIYIALRNIIENAFRHAVVGGCVKISGTQNASGWQISVEDDGPGFGSPDAQPGALQLGMSIVARIVKAMGGVMVKDRSEQLGGARVVLEFPHVASLT